MSLTRLTFLLSFTLASAAFLGCSEVRVPFGSGPDPADASISGNWQFKVAPSSGSAPFSELSGAIDATPDTSQPGQSAVTAVLLAPSIDCFDGAPIVPFHGTLTDDTLQLSSFLVNGQLVTLSASQNQDGTLLQGTYRISGGCADGAAGTLSGVRYQAIQGTFVTTSQSSLPGLTLQLQQAMQDSGDGTFSVNGTLHLASSPCITQGVLQPAMGTISGSHVQLVFDLEGSGGNGQLTLTGETDPSADTLTFEQATISGNTCASSLGTLQLNKQS